MMPLLGLFRRKKENLLTTENSKEELPNEIRAAWFSVQLAMIVLSQVNDPRAKLIEKHLERAHESLNALVEDFRKEA